MLFPSPDSFAASRASLQEQETEIEVDEVFWKTRIEPLLHELEKGKTTLLVLNKNLALICIPHGPDIFSGLGPSFLWICWKHVMYSLTL